MHDHHAPPVLDRWFAKIFDDEQSSHFGSGWWSGIASVFLGVLGLGAVATLYFPDLLSSAQLRAKYPMEFMRALIEIIIGISFLSGCLSMLLRRRKILGLIGIALATIAALLGGGEVPIENAASGRFYLG